MKWQTGIQNYLCLSVCACVSAFVCPILVSSRTSTFINIFENDFAHLFSLTSTSVMQKVCFDMPKVTVEGQMFKLTLSEA